MPISVKHSNVWSFNTKTIRVRDVVVGAMKGAYPPAVNVNKSGIVFLGLKDKEGNLIADVALDITESCELLQALKDKISGMLGLLPWGV